MSFWDKIFGGFVDPTKIDSVTGKTPIHTGAQSGGVEKLRSLLYRRVPMDIVSGFTRWDLYRMKTVTVDL